MGSQAEKAGASWGKIGTIIGNKIRDPFVKAFKTVSDKTKAFGTQFKTTSKNIGNFLKHPIETIKGKLYDALTRTEKKIADVSDGVDDMGSNIEDAGSQGENGIGKIVGALKKMLAAVLAVKSAQAVSSFVKDAIGASETLAAAESKLTNLLGKNAEAANKWADEYASAANRSAGEVKSFMAETAGAFRAYGVNSEELDKLAESATALGYDIAAAYKKDDAEVMSQMIDAIRGNKEALGEYGVALDDVTLKKTAAQMGIKGEIGALTEAQQCQVRYQAILNQTKDAQLGVFNSTGSYTNGIKSIKGIYENFLATAGSKFQPILGGLFDSIIKMWPKVEPALTGVVDILSEGLAEAVPVISELAEELIPVLAETIGTIFTEIKPLVPIILDLVKKLLPPVTNIIKSLVENFLPPLVSIIEIVIPPIVEIVEQLLPPLIDLFDTIGPMIMDIVDGILPPLIDFIQQLIPPIIQLIDEILPPIIDLVSSLIPFVVQIVEAVLPPMLDIIQMLLPPMTSLIEAILPVIQKVMEAIMPIFTKLVESLMPVIQTILIAIEPLLSAISPILETIGSALGVVIEAIAWIVDKVVSVGTWVLSLFSIDAGSATEIKGTQIPSNAGGTDNFEGGWTHINELGGEMAYLPKGSQIIPADKSQQVADALTAATEQNNSSGVTYNISVPITIQGNVDTTVMATIEAQIKTAVKQALDEAQQKEMNDRILQFA